MALKPLNRRRIVGLALVALLLAAAMTVGLVGCGAGDRLFYWPNNLDYLPQQVIDDHHIENVYFASADGTKLHGWFVPARGVSERRGTVIYYHGNAQNLTAHYAFVSWLGDEGYDLFLFDYRGFGRSEGEPSRQGLYEDSVAAMKYVLSRNDVDRRTLVAFGQSLGGACLVSALGEFEPIPVRAVAVESTFASYRGVAREKVASTGVLAPIAWPIACWLVTGDHDPVGQVGSISPVPLLVLHGDADPIVPFSQGQALYARGGEPKHFEHVPGGLHCDAVGSDRFGAKYRQQLLEFFDRAIAKGEQVTEAP